MEIRFLVVLELVCVIAAQGQKKVCFAPVACSAGYVTSSEWMEIESKSQCNSMHSEETVPTQATITESRIKTLIDEFVAKFRSEMTNLLSSKSDNDELNRLRNDVTEMNKTFNQNNARLEIKLTEINKTLRLLNDSLKPEPGETSTGSTPKPACPHVGNITYNNKCYWIILHNRTDVNYTQAQELCSKGGGSPGDILSKAHYDLMGAKVREMTSSSTQFWLGMKINPSTKVVTLSNGTRAPFIKWYSTWPKSFPDYTNMLVQVDQPPSSDGMFHHQPTVTPYGVFCQA